jgi:hypothetical protein
MHGPGPLGSGTGLPTAKLVNTESSFPKCNLADRRSIWEKRNCSLHTTHKTEESVILICNAENLRKTHASNAFA